jgi:ribosomal protein L22
MSPDTPAEPPQGKPAEDEQIEREAAEAKQAKPRARKAAKAKAAGAETAAKAQSEPATKKRAAKAEKKAPAGEQAETKAASKAARKPPRKAAKTPQPAASEKAPVPAARTRGSGKGAAKAPRRRVVSAHARYVRTSARKARMVCGHIRGKSVQEARAILAFTPREAARDWSKLLESAVANAESNHELLEDDLVIREAYADEGPTIKRFRPRAMGRATPIRKRTSHLTITLTPRPEPGTTNRHG